MSIYCYAEKILIQTSCGKKDVDSVPEAKNRILSGSASTEDRQIDVNRAIPSRKEVRPFFKNIFLAKRDFFGLIRTLRLEVGTQSASLRNTNLTAISQVIAS